MKVCRFAMLALAAMILSGTCGAAAEFKNGTAFALGNVPKELVVERRAGEPVRFSLEENQTTGFTWEVESNTNECEIALERRGRDGKTTCGAPGNLDVTVTSRIYTPARVEFRYRRPWEKDAAPWKAMRLIVYTVGEAKDPRYPRTAVNLLLEKECARRGITLVDWHLHIRGGMTPELAYVRETNSFVRSSAMENHGREWEIYDNARLRDFAARARKANPKMPVGIQVNDRDWFEKIDAGTRAQFDYILADSMIMGKLPSGRDNRLWMVTERLWTGERMRAVIAKCIEKGIAIEIQAESAFPRPSFLRLAKEMGAKFSFGTNNFDPGPKNLSKWLEAIVWLDLGPSDIWTPPAR